MGAEAAFQFQPAPRQFAPGGLAGVPVALADGLGHAFEDLRLRRGVVPLEPGRRSQPAGIGDVGVEQRLPLVVPHRGGIRRLPAEQVAGRLQHFQRAGIALPPHGGDPLGVQVARAQFVGQEARQPGRPGAARAQIGHQQLGRLAVQVAHGGRQPAQELERVVRRQHPVQVRRTRHHRRLHAPQLLGQRIDACRRLAPGALPVGVPAAVEELPPQRGIAVPCGRAPRQIGHAGPVGSRRAAEDALARDPRGRLRRQAARRQGGLDAAAVAGDRIAQLVQRGQARQRIVEQPHEGVELVPVHAGDLDDHIDARTAQFGGGDDLQRRDAAALVPDRPQPQGMQDLRLGDAQMADRLGCPQAEGDLARPGAAVRRAERLDQLRIGGGGRVVGGARRDLVGLEGIQVAAAHRVGIADRVAARARLDEPARQAGQQGFVLAGIAQPAIQLPRPCGQGRRGGRQGRGRKAGRHGSGRQHPAHRLVGGIAGQDGRIGRERLAAVHPQRREQRRAQLLHDGGDAVRGLGRLAEDVQAQRHGRPRQFVQVVVQGPQKTLEILLGARHRPAEVLVQVGRGSGLADPGGRPFAHGAAIELLVLVDQLVQVAQFVVQPGRRERRRLVADGHRPAAAPGLDRLADIVLDVGIEHRQAAHGQPGIVVGGQPAVLAGQPLLRAVRAQVDQRVRAVLPLQVQVGRQVERVGHAGGIVIVGPRIGVARHLRHDQQVPEPPARDHEIAPAADLAHRAVPGGIAQGAQPGPAALRQPGQPALVVFQRIQAGQAFGQQGLRRHAAVQRAQHPLARRDGPRLVHRRAGIVAVRRQRGLDGDDAAGNVQVRGSQVLLAGRVVPEHQRQLLVRRRRAAQRHQAAQLGDQGIGLGGQQVAHARCRGGQDQRIADPPALRAGQEHGGRPGRHAAGGRGPVGRRAVAEAERLDHRHVQRPEVPAPRRAVAQVGEIDQDVDAARAEDARQALRIGRVGPEHEGQQSGRFGALDQFVHFPGQQVGDHAGVDQEGDPARGGTGGIPPRRLPGQIVLHALEDAGRARMIEAGLRQAAGRREQVRGRIAPVAHGPRQGEEAPEVVRAAGGIQGRQRAGHGRRQPLPRWGTAPHRQAGRGVRRRGGAGLAQAPRHPGPVPGARHVQHDQRGGPHRGAQEPRLGRIDVQVAQGHGLRPGEVPQALELLRRDEIVVQHEHRRRAGTGGLRRGGREPGCGRARRQARQPPQPQQPQHAQQPPRQPSWQAPRQQSRQPPRQPGQPRPRRQAARPPAHFNGPAHRQNLAVRPAKKRRPSSARSYASASSLARRSSVRFSMPRCRLRLRLSS